ncbi:MAG: thioredoxin family protein [Planctomycetaceae bacterium]|nr:thioredoxin family protein [Planctomycetaceae bacterium]
MLSTTIAVLLQSAVLSASPTMTYEQAYAESEKTGKPLVVLVGAEWCPGCRVMKNTSMPQVKQDGVFQEVSFTTVDTDTQGEIARQVTGGGAIPQLVLFQRDGAGWKTEKLVGAQNPATIIKFLRKGVQAAVGRIANRE